MFTHTHLLRAAALAFAALYTLPALAQPTSPTTFTYQGSLSSSGSPLTGQADLRATLFSTATDGSPVASAIDIPNTTVTNGLFTIPLDFGSAFDSGQLRWIEFGVRSPAGTGSFTTLQPRQPITPTPLAQGLAGIPLRRGGPEALDSEQSQGISTGFEVNATANAWQSWTPVLTGNLSRLQLRAVSSSFQAEILTIRVHFGLGTSGPVIGVVTASIPSDSSTSVRSIPMPDIPVQAGAVYTLAFSGQVFIFTSSQQLPGASGNDSGIPRNWWFQTFITPANSINASSTSTAFAALAGTAQTAESAHTAESAPWSGLTGQAAVTTPAIGTNWQFLFHNTSIPTFRGGARLADSGFLELTNTANLTSPNFARLNSAGAWTAVSDARLKTEIATAENTLAAALQLRPVTFRWKQDGTEDLGLIAQEVRTVLPSLVSGDESKDTLTLNYSQLSVVAIGAIQEQQRQINALRAEAATRAADRAEIDRLARENAALKARLSRLEKILRAHTLDE